MRPGSTTAIFPEGAAVLLSLQAAPADVEDVDAVSILDDLQRLRWLPC
jgi:hypothetical protein